MATVYSDESLTIRDRVRSHELERQIAEDYDLDVTDLQFLPPDAELVGIEEECIAAAIESPSLDAYLTALGDQDYEKAKKLLARNAPLKAAIMQLSLETRRHLHNVQQQKVELFGGDLASYTLGLVDALREAGYNDPQDFASAADAEVDEILEAEYQAEMRARAAANGMSQEDMEAAMADLAAVRAEAEGTSVDATTEKIAARVNTALAMDAERAERKDEGKPRQTVPPVERRRRSAANK